MIENNLALAPNYNKLNPYTKVDTANGMPIKNFKVVDPINHNLRAKEFAEKQNLRDIYARNLAPSVGYDTEKFLKAKNMLSPIYIYNEAKSKYDMISRIPFKNKDFQAQIDFLA